MGSKRQRKKRDLEFFPPEYQVRADGTRKGPTHEAASKNDVQVLKQSQNEPIGIRLKDVDVAGTNVVEVSHIDTEGLFADSKLRVGMEVSAVNGILCKSARNGHAFLHYAETEVKLHAKLGRNMFQTGDGSVQCTATEDGLEVEPVEPPYTPPKAKQKPRKKKHTPFRNWMNQGDVSRPACVKQGRTRFKKTPKDTKRQNDLKNTLWHGLDQLSKSILPAKSPKSRKEMTKGIVVEYFDKERGEYHIILAIMHVSLLLPMR